MSSLGDQPALHVGGEIPSPWRVARIQNAQQDVYRLLEFATEHGRSAGDGIMRQAVEIARLEACTMTAAEEEALWETRRVLSDLVVPAHAAGLQLMDLLEQDAPATIEPRTLRGWSGRWLLVAMLTVAAVHVYAVVGGQLTNDATEQSVRAGVLVNALRAAVSSTPQAPGAPSLPTTTVAGAPVLQGGIVSPLALTLEDAETEIARVDVAVDAHRARLATWNAFWRVWPAFLGHGPSGASTERSDESNPAEPGADPTVARSNRARALVRQFTTRSLPPFDQELYAAKVAQTAVMTYLLPILYGALGAFVFVVRVVTNDIDRGSLRMLLRIRYRIRLMLGAIFGLTISMLTTQATQSPSQATLFIKDIPVGAVGLAFLAGYGIDVVFGVLDAVIARARRFGLEQMASANRPPDTPLPHSQGLHPERTSLRDVPAGAH